MRKRPKALLDTTDFAAAARRVLAGYETFIAHSGTAAEDGDAKAFTAHHAAARSALAHLEQLLKLAAESGSEAQLRDVSTTLQEARQQIAGLEAEEVPPDADEA